jgi:cAMP-dependent protein kinase regulator
MGVQGSPAVERFREGWSALQDRVWPPVLAEVPVFSALSRRHLRWVARLTDVRRFDDGAVVVRSGARGDAFYVILDGSAVVSPSRRRTPRLEAGEHFGELALIDGAPRSATVVADGELTVARIGRTPFAKLLREEPLVAAGLTGGLVGIVRELQREETKHVQARSRVADGQAGTTLDLGGALGFRSLLFAVPLFASVSTRHLDRLADLTRMRRYRANEPVVTVGAPGNAFYVILDGHAEVETPEGHARRLGPGEFFGELALLDAAPRSATVIAIDELTVERVPRAAFQKLLREEPTIAVSLNKGLVGIIRDLQQAGG